MWKHRLSRDLFTYSYAKFYLNIACYYSILWLWDLANGYKNYFSKWISWIYAEQPLDFIFNDKSHKVCKLQRSIYRLKQVSQSQNTCFNDVIKSFDFIKKEKEPCVYKKVSGSVMIFLYYMWMTSPWLGMIFLCWL